MVYTFLLSQVHDIGTSRLGQKIRVYALLFFAILVYGKIASAPVHAAEVTIVPASGSQFNDLIQGCWMRNTSGGISSICFDEDGKAYVMAYSDSGRDALVGAARFSITEGKLHLEGSGDAWPFERSLVTCDGVVKPSDELMLARCAGSGELIGQEVGVSPVYSVSDSRWQFVSTLIDCDWCDMAIFE